LLGAIKIELRARAQPLNFEFVPANNGANQRCRGLRWRSRLHPRYRRDRPAAIDRLAARPHIPAMLRLNLAHAIAPLRLREFFAMATVFWIYVALSNILYAEAMELVVREDGRDGMFAHWNVRLLQHGLLFPFLLLCYAASLRLGWSPWERQWLPQLLLAALLALLARPCMTLADYLVGMGHYWQGADELRPSKPMPEFKFDGILAGWLASFTSFLVAYGFGLALLTGFAGYRRLRDREAQLQTLESQWTEARLATLKMQLSPHTLFNLLNTIRGQIAWDPPAAQKMVVQLADLLRRLLNAGEKDFVPLRDELHFVSLYLQLQQQRFSDRLQIRLPSLDEIPAVSVPSLILQPLIENAVVHGLAGHEGSVTIEVSVTLTAGRLQTRICNTFVPRDGAVQAGLGIRNVRERLIVQFGERARLDSAAAGSQWWCALLDLPT
jgi:hypothetical protein